MAVETRPRDRQQPQTARPWPVASSPPFIQACRPVFGSQPDPGLPSLLTAQGLQTPPPTQGCGLGRLLSQRLQFLGDGGAAP